MSKLDIKKARWSSHHTYESMTHKFLNKITLAVTAVPKLFCSFATEEVTLQLIRCNVQLLITLNIVFMSAVFQSNLESVTHSTELDSRMKTADCFAQFEIKLDSYISTLEFMK